MLLDEPAQLLDLFVGERTVRYEHLIWASVVATQFVAPLGRLPLAVPRLTLIGKVSPVNVIGTV